ncbi:hypothetical protein [Methylobacterium oxalidis]|uniref:Uncharacterized protein n=1 Tax=Methylobacterium oxalidis TaxID=944322 RepID=A0A512J643_9HYPH|nr:hypothetical protein [Methylobacterium oxalidis]GEP05329.1 hypothetical protein MOX02_33670 [Methylobacterium oxalidis]GJE31340.1 hypothetical protein LDDCCGHA_1517 [Methylobacterium oxalidis]GLS63532.1 hypothetical protein GCM10007888_19130 [Methylobacterium oxalidis]
MDNITLQPVQIASLCADTDGRIAFADGKLVAVLVRLSEELHGADGRAGQWCVEVGFGACDVGVLSVRFDGLDAARRWIAERMAMATTD